ncbi:glucose-1-phosphate cytidylyltransferase [Cohnella faecalis]|uniref:Glucose-1-phosphate cytidylyltransferase n=1 Tax=Cohnella faecalis TaxID=2315694 RepID=A0A398CHU7_9BACL|nr:glucose-1-phosphate cytidylyltransferase [Cohnella faecalis]RIE02826.1 glucose-1-phosphate cytidylyltransferase [Cohnella faecalis]
MKVVLLAGGYGTRISEETHLRPKPMIEIGDKPILWHIMKIFSHYGMTEFVICLGYKGFVIKEYFARYYLLESDITFDFKKENEMIVHQHTAEPWKVTLVNTGLDTMTGGRLKRVQPYLEGESFMLTYGDGVADIDIAELAAFHSRHGKIATVTAVQPSGRFGMLDLQEDGSVAGFQEKPKGDGGWINGGFFVLRPDIFDYIEGDDTVFEQGPLIRLAQEDQLQGYKHDGFWHPMDTLRDKTYLDALWKTGNAPWKMDK